MTQPPNTYSSNKPYLFRAIFEWLLDNDATPYILVDARRANVEVPHEYIKDGQIVLNITPSAVQDWLADNEAISFRARFAGVARQIYVPMDALMAVYAQENGLGMAFPALDDAVEGDAENDFSKASEKAPDTARAEIKPGSDGPKKVEATKPKSVESSKPKKSDSSKPKNTDPSKPKKGSHLKVIK